MSAAPAPREEGSGSAGVACALGAYGIWGFAPAYWKELASFSASEVLAHRVLWSCVVGLALVVLARSGPELASVLRSARRAGPVFGGALLLGANWLTFIWAVNHDQVLATSLGYYINPLLSVVLGVVFLGERLRRWQLVAFAVAAAGVAQLALALGELPWVALVLAGSFGLYGLVRKVAPASPVAGFATETLLLSPLAGLYLWRLGAAGASALPVPELGTNALVAASGIVTAAPLVLFASAAKRLRLATVGFFQYIAPTVAFGLAVGVYGEPFTLPHAITFGCVWMALAIYSIDSLRAARGV